jgi:hypothetical protein
MDRFPLDGDDTVIEIQKGSGLFQVQNLFAGITTRQFDLQFG